MRCLFALHIYLKGTVENNDPYILFDKVIDYTMGLESLYLLKEEWHRERKLSRRIAYLLGKDENEEDRLSKLVTKFHEIRNDIVHASLVSWEDAQFLSENIYVYEDILRRSILAFLDLNLKIPTKEEALIKIDTSKSEPEVRKEIHESLQLLEMRVC
jgi:hypothetical protein